MFERMALVLLLLSLPPAVSAGAVHEFKLENGLKVLVQQDRRAPVVVSQLWYRVGSSYEDFGHTGLSHMLEHMMFKGTERYGPGEFNRIMSDHGASSNAFTGRDYTAYFQRLAADRLAISFELEADRMTGLVLDAGELERERQVVTEERRLRTEDNPQSLTYEQFSAVAHTASPYRNPIIGWMADIEAYEQETIAEWYRSWYGPDNAILVVVGDVEPEAVYALAVDHFGSLPPAGATPPPARPEPPRLGERRVTVRVPAEVPYLIMGYPVPTLATADEDWEPYALEVLAGVLGGRGGRLQRDLVRTTEQAASIGVGYSMTSRLEDLLTLGGNPTRETTTEELESALRAQVARVQAELVTEDELARVRAQVIANDVYQRDSQFYQAMRLGILETVGVGWGRLDDYVPRVNAVTPEQVQAVARKYLRDEHLTVAVLDPLPLDGSKPPAPALPDATLMH